MNHKLLVHTLGICATIIIASNIIMATVMNHGGEIFSNLFLIVLTVVFFPGFFGAITKGESPKIKAELAALVLLAIISVLRLINRIRTLPSFVNIAAVTAAIFLGVVLLVVAAIRLFGKKR